MIDAVKIRVTIRTNKVGSECVDVLEFDREEWESMTAKERDVDCFEVAMNMVEWDWDED